MKKITFKLACIIIVLFFGFKMSAQCVPSGMVDWNNFGISNFTITGDAASTINNNSIAEGQYSDHTSLSVNVTAGNTYSFSATNTKDTWGDLKMRFWIDYDGTGNYVQVYDSGGYVNNGNSSQTFSGNITIDIGALTGSSVLRIAASYCSSCGGNEGVMSTDACNFHYRAEVEDYTLNITGATLVDPLARDNSLAVLKDSTSGVSNQIDVSSNDNIGTSDGTDGDDYAINVGPTNGTVTEVSDGVFEYIPNTGFIGTDSFTYNLCDANNDCDTATVSIVVNLGHCEPTSNSGGSHYITNFTLVGDTNTINNTSGDDGGYASYLDSSYGYADLTRNNTYTASISTVGSNVGWSVYIDLNQDGDFVDAGELIGDTNGEGTGNLNITIPATSALGETVLRVGARRYWSSNVPCGNSDGQPEEFEDYKVEIINHVTTQDIQVLGNDNFIFDGDTSSSTDNHTYYGIYDINSGALNRSFEIRNDGVVDLTLTSPYVSITGSADFSITTFPTDFTLAPGESDTFGVSFNPSSIGLISATLSVHSDDPEENPYVFVVEGEGAQTFPDTDGDGVSDNVDIDDDNDGLTDEEETLSCTSYPFATTTDLVFLNETFGAGQNRVMINGNYAGVTTSYCYEDGTGSCPATYNPTSVNDGDYTVHYTITNDDDVADDIDTDISQWAEDYWYAGEDHTPGDTYGRMAIFNATEEPGVFYNQFISGAVANVPIQFGFYAINIDRDDIDSSELATRERPEVIITIYDPNGNVIASETSGLIEPTSPAGDWVEVSASFTTSYTQFTVELSNANLGGLGNDLAIDDVFVKQTLCDLDGDGVADIIDLDNDNDGIPNVVELGLIDDNYDATVYNDTTNPWVDANGNGLHDAYEGLVPRDSDGDGVPDYLDLDSDNDGIYDNVEYNGLGDVDISGDGLGEGSDYEDNSNKIDDNDFDGDGILSLMDDNDDDSDTASTTDHGTFSYPDPLDTDGDGVPDYLDIDSNDASNNPSDGSDIDTTIYVHLDANGDGIIDGTTDSDKDGLLDSFDTNDSAYGSPRDLDDSYSLYFDGRNDYVEDGNVLTSGDASLMVWIKTDGSNHASTNGIIAGQSNFYLQLNHSDNSITLMLDGSAVITSTDLVVDGVWTHVSATTNSDSTTLYINGVKQDGALSNGGVSADISNFTIGKQSGVDTNYFKGEIDEVRVFNVALTQEEQQATIYQELDENFSFNQGKIIPKNISENSIGTNLLKYYKMDGYKDDVTDNKVTLSLDQVTGAKLYNIKNIYYQTAPLPYVTNTDGPWTTEATWLHGNVWDIEDVQTNKNWSIVHIKNNVTSNATHTNLGFLIDENQMFTVLGDNKIENNWYLELNGALDLKDDSQLVQTNKSDLVTSSSGKILRRQEGNSSFYRYNYWSSPVGSLSATTITDNNITSNNANNTSFSLSMIKDQNGDDFEFTNAYHEEGKISTYWLFTFINAVTYSNWASIDIYDQINSGVGYTSKGVGVGSEQQYLFEGKPNNGTIVIPVLDTGGAGSEPADTKTDYLLGNPYPSAIDIHKFIDDNEGTIDGTIQLWQQWSGSSHVLNQYNGGYAQVNKTGSIRAYQFVGIEGGNNGNQDGTKIPTRYLPVSQGFMVEILADGDVVFNNGQRVFVKEIDADGSYDNGSVFFREAVDSQNSTESDEVSVETEEEIMQRIRLEFNSVDGPQTKRELLLGFSNQTSDEFDYGFEAKNLESNNDDLSLLMGEDKYTIQAYSNITDDKVVSLALQASGEYNYTVSLTDTDYISEDQKIYLRDNLTNTYHNLREGAYQFLSQGGEFNDRLEIVFQTEEDALSVSENLEENLQIYYAMGRNKIVVLNPEKENIESVKMINMLGQELPVANQVYHETYSEYRLNNISAGAYVVVLSVKNKGVVTKKIIIN